MAYADFVRALEQRARTNVGGVPSSPSVAFGLNVSRAAGGIPGPVTIAPIAPGGNNPVLDELYATVRNQALAHRQATRRAEEARVRARLADQPVAPPPPPAAQAPVDSPAHTRARHALPFVDAPPPSAQGVHAQRLAVGAAQVAAASIKEDLDAYQRGRQITGTPRISPASARAALPFADAPPAPVSRSSAEQDRALMAQQLAQEARSVPTTQDGTPVLTLPLGGTHPGTKREKPKEAGIIPDIGLPDFISKENLGKGAEIVLDTGRRAVTDVEGGLMNMIASGKDPGLPFGIAERVHRIFGPEINANIRKAYDEGYNGYTGGRAVHEYLMSETNDWPLVAKFGLRAVVDTFEDPWSWIGPLGKTGRFLKEGGRAAKVVGTVLEAPQQVLDVAAKVPKYAAGRTLEAAGLLPGIGKGVQKAATKTPRQVKLDAEDRIRQAADEYDRFVRAAPTVLPDSAYDPTEWTARWKTAHPKPAAATRLIPNISRVGTATERIVDKAAGLATAARDNPQVQQAWKVFTDLYDDLAQDANLVDAAVVGKPFGQRVRLEGIAALDNMTNLVTAWKASFGQLGEAFPDSAKKLIDYVPDAVSATGKATAGSLPLKPTDPVNWMMRYVFSTDAKEVKDAAVRLANGGYKDLYKPLREMRRRWKEVKDTSFGDLLPPLEDPSRPLDYVDDVTRGVLEGKVTSRFGVDQRMIDTLGQYGQEAQDLAATLIPRIQATGMNVKRLARTSIKDLEKRLPLKRAEIKEIKDFIDDYLPYADKVDDLVGDVGILSRRRAADELSTIMTEYIPPEYSRWGRLGRSALRVAPTLARMSLNDVTNWVYVARNVISNEQMANLPGDVGKVVLAEGGLVKNLGRALKEDISGHPVYEWLDSWGVGKGITEPIMGRRGAAGFEGDRDVTAIERWLGTRKKGGITQAIEDIQRGGTLITLLKNGGYERLPGFAENMATLASKVGVNADEVRDALLKMPLKNGAGDVHDLLFDIAQRAGTLTPKVLDDFATRGYRDWASITRKISNEARDEVRRRFAIGAERNIDRWLNPVVAFHRWPSRALPYLLEEAIRHPGIVNAWWRANEEAREYSADHPGTLKGAILVSLTTPLGLGVFLDPNAFSLVSQLWNMSDPTEPDELTDLGKKVRSGRKYGLGVWPLLLEGLNMTGALGNEYQSGPVSLPSVRLGLRWLDVLQTQMGDGFHDPAVLDLMSKGRESFSRKLSGTVPGINRVEYKPSTGGTERDVHEVVVSQHPELSPQPGDSPEEVGQKIQALADVMSDPDHPYVEQAEKDLAWGKALQQTWNQLPTGVVAIRTRPTARFEREVRANQGVELPTDEVEADLVTSGSLEAANLALTKYQTTSEAPFSTGGIGERARQTFNDIVYGTTAEPGVVYAIGNKSWTPQELQALTKDERTKLADQWLTEMGRLDEYQYAEAKRDAVAAGNPVQAEYEAWKKTVPFDPEPLAQWRAVKAEENQQFADALADQERYLREQNFSPEEYQSRLDGWTRGTDSFLLTTGRRPTVYDAQPEQPSTVNQPLQTAPGVTPPGLSATPAGFDPVAQLTMEQAQFSAQMDQIDALLSQHFGRPIKLSEMGHPMQEEGMKNLVASWGIAMPTPSEALRGYWNWTDLQEPDADTSPAAYVTWYRTFMTSNAATAPALGTGQLASQPTTITTNTGEQLVYPAPAVNGVAAGFIPDPNNPAHQALMPAAYQQPYRSPAAFVPRTPEETAAYQAYLRQLIPDVG